MIEIERKFWVAKEKWKPAGEGRKLVQGYLSVDPERTIRVRIVGEQAFITIKGKTEGIRRTEFEYKIPKSEGEILLNMCLYSPVEKIRFKEKIGDCVWEIDVFGGANQGLILAEVELEQDDQQIQLPAWVGKEVSGDVRFYNSYLAVHPFSFWQNKPI
ncbi:MAG: CYTH domain-containing protein [Prolixibacteraceae bacterium]|nr:CYTH domain-containing protein [Prolixibacteraceae bacterium]